MMGTDPLARRRQENIAGYVIAMWHLEDLLRANRFDPDAVEELLVAPMEGNEATRNEVRHWYQDMIARMQAEGIEHGGHLSEVMEVIDELEFLHGTLIGSVADGPYLRLYEAAEADIAALQRTQGDHANGPIATCLTGIYGVMLLRAKGTPIGEATGLAEARMRRLLDALSEHYKHMRKLPGVSLN